MKSQMEPMESARRSKYKEPIQHGNAFFPLSIHETDIRLREGKTFHTFFMNGEKIGGLKGPGQEPPLYFHCHRELELFWVCKGTVKIGIENEVIQLNEGDVLLIRPDRIHGSNDCLKGDLIYRTILFSYDFVGSMENDVIRQNYIDPMFSVATGPYIFLSSKQQGCERLFHLLNDAYCVYEDSGRGFELLLKARILEFFYEVVKSGKILQKPEQTNARMGLFMKKMNHYISENYSDRIELNDAARHVSMSKGYFCRYFKHAFHMTFHEYLTNIRLREAENLVRTTHLGMEEIAIRTGFSNSNYFTVSFKKHYHMIPTKYRNISRL
ncbi:AraC family transcriptional regulator [Lacrimispora amygdalina]|uniref:AraC family transcriptional regulator n=1 Tax=Lacrimispora amygdalina TaxID=253257 RepID=UPI000BE3D2E9|nr:helix-turn-helix domain-containing protein [Lacrimispora amygdalina]